MNKQIIHIATDEKFIDSAYSTYESAFPQNNIFIILIFQPVVEHLSSSIPYVFVNSSDDYIEIIDSLSESADLIVFHGLILHQAILAQRLNKKRKKFIWSLFGSEAYNKEYFFDRGCIGEKTYQHFISSYRKSIKDLLRPVYYIFRQDKLEENIFRTAFRRMDFLASAYEEEFELFKNIGLLEENSEFLQFSYYPIDVIINKEANFVNSSNILLGNSATYTNNHLEIFEILENQDLENRQVVTILSYGNTKYASEIIKIGNEKLKSSFRPITEFLTLTKYQELLQSCGIVIMNHYRQQGVGNIMNSLYIGAKVFLSEQSSLFHYLKRLGCSIFSIESELVCRNEDTFRLLDQETKEKNRMILESILSQEQVVHKLSSQLFPLLSDSR